MHKRCMDFLDDLVNICILYHGLQDNTQHFHHKSLPHMDLYIRDSIDRIIYLADSLRCIGKWACTIELKNIQVM